MKITKQALAALSVIMTLVIATVLVGCASKPKVTVVELENKGTSMKVDTPEWIKTYTAYGISRVQAQSEFKDRYCVIGEESGVNRQFVLAWADNFSAQQRIGAMLRTTIASKYKAKGQGAAQSQGGANASTASGEYNQEIDNVINAVVKVSYSGAQREADWWSLNRRYDPDQKGVYRDEYTAYVLYTIPKAELDRQVAKALETAVKADSALYDITLQLARDILLEGFTYLGEGELAAVETPPQTPEEKKAISAAGPTGNITIRNNSSDNGGILTTVKIYSGIEAKGTPYLVYDKPVLVGQQASWDLPEGAYTVEVFLNKVERSAQKIVSVTAGDRFTSDFWSSDLVGRAHIDSFTKKD